MAPSQQHQTGFRQAKAAPLLPVLLFVCLGSLGTGTVMNGVSFLAKYAYGFDRTTNFLLLTVLGLAYIPGAIFVGPALRRLCDRAPWLNPRSAVACLTIFIGVLSMLPFAAERLGLPGGPWPIWVIAVAYSAASGAMWPIMESYLSGGRKGRTLRVAIGRFNIVWTSSVVASFWLMGPFVEQNPREVLVALGLLHILAAAALFFLPASPAAHPVEHHQTPTRKMLKLLAIARILLPASYLLMSALNAFFPYALESIGVPTNWQTPLVATWMLSRVATMVTLERWHAWHGRWRSAAGGAAALVIGFAGCVVIPWVAPGALATGTATALLAISLAILGVGFGMTYTAALDYVLDVGEASVDAGGSHEALIGVGYTVGPLLGLLASSAEQRGYTPPGSFEGLFLVLTGAVCAVTAAWAGRVLFRGPGEPEAASAAKTHAADDTQSR